MSATLAGPIILIALAALLGLAPAAIAERKGRSFPAWWLFGTLLLVPALVASLVISEDPHHQGSRVACPRCAELVQSGATMCRFCGLEAATTGRRAFIAPPTARDSFAWLHEHFPETRSWHAFFFGVRDDDQEQFGIDASDTPSWWSRGLRRTRGGVEPPR